MTRTVRMLSNYCPTDFVEDGVYWKGELYDIDEATAQVSVDRMIDEGICVEVFEKDLAELYVLANVDADGNVVSYPKGGGSPTPGRIKAYDSLASAKRGKAHHNGVIVKVTGVEVIGI